MRDYPYSSLGYPYSHVPAPGEPVTMATVGEAILPLLKTVQCAIETFGNAAEHGELLNDRLGITLGVLAGQLDLAITLLDRLEDEGDDRDTPATP